MHNTAYCIVAGTRRGKSDFSISVTLLLACCALWLFCGSFVAAAQDQPPAEPAAQNQQQPAPSAQSQQPAAPTPEGQQPAATAPQGPQPAAAPAKEMPPMPAAPSEGKAIICIYRIGGVVGSASHDHLYVNGVYLGTLLNSEYAWTEVEPGTVVLAGMAKMYYGPSIIMSSAAAVNQTRGQSERIRVQAEAGKTYYMKWTSGMFGSDIKVKLVNPDVGAKEMSKLHPTKPADTGEGKGDNTNPPK
jgi:hypothetical protein